MAVESPETQSTMPDFIREYRDQALSYDTMHSKECEDFSADAVGVTAGLLTTDAFVDKYKADLEELVVSMTFNREEKRKYRANPWVLSYDLYGSTEFWFLLLDLNGMYSATEFNKSTVLVYDGSLPSVIETILAAEAKFIQSNEVEIANRNNIELNNGGMRISSFIQ